MKVIDLLNKIANNEEVPEKIFYANQYWINKYPNDYEGLGYGGCLLNNVCLNNLNDEVEIVGEKKIPEKIDVWYDPIKDTKLERHDTDTSIEILAAMCDDLKDKYNEIIDYLREKEDE